MAVKSLIETVTVGAGGAASIEFTDIPQDGSDLVLMLSSISSAAAANEPVGIRFNNDTSSSYAQVHLRGNTVASSAFTSTGLFHLQSGGTTVTANTPSNNSAYISNYTSTSNKSISMDSVSENNSSTNFDAIQYLSAGNYSTSSAITSMQLYGNYGGNFAQYSTASLYKIKYD